MRLRLAIGGGVLAICGAAAAWLTTEVVMTPTSPERTRLIAMYVAIGAATVVVALAVQELTRGSISRRLLGATLIGPLVVAVTAIVGAQTMFLSAHDAQFIIILIALVATLAVGVVSMLARPLIRDLERLRRVADEMGQGNFGARSEVGRRDELGDLGRAFDTMADRLEESSAERQAAEESRQFFMTSLSHDARTPLTAMRAAVEALLDGMAPDPERYLRSIEKDLHGVEAIIENMFVLGKLDAGQVVFEPVDLDIAELVDVCIEGLVPIAVAADLTLQRTGPASVPVRGSWVEMERVVQNLLSNAIRHSPAGSHITVDVTTSGSVEVLDEGPGFAEDFVDTAFEQFTRAETARDRAHGGAGLGLAVARGLVEGLGGRIWASPGPGGRVGFSLPVS